MGNVNRRRLNGLCMNSVIIAPQRRRALLRLLPNVLLAFGVAISYASYFRYLTPCDDVLDVRAAYWALLAFTYGVPSFLFIISLPNCITAYKVFKHGYYPPLDSVSFRTLTAYNNAKAYIRGGLLLLVPLLALLALYWGHMTYSRLVGERTYLEVQARFDEQCASDHFQ